MSWGEKCVNEKNVDWFMISDCMFNKNCYWVKYESNDYNNWYVLLICFEFC